MDKSPVAVLISDVHYSLATLDKAHAAFVAALEKSEELGVSLIDCGDLTNDKAILRAEVVNTLLDAMSRHPISFPYLLVGNHSLINEKGKAHALSFLHPYANIISDPTHVALLDYSLYFIPYQSNPDDFRAALKDIPKGSTIICHQGFKGAFMGDYIQDKSSIDPEILRDYAVISGHYHKHQIIITDELNSVLREPSGIGTITYVGNPYTLTFGEANDGPKGYLILYSDGSLERVILDLPKHVIIEKTTEELFGPTGLALDMWEVSVEDKLLVKITGPKSELAKVSKQDIGRTLLGHTNYRLDLIPTESAPHIQHIENMSDSDLLDKLIDDMSESQSHKDYLKVLWREVNETR